MSILDRPFEMTDLAALQKFLGEARQNIEHSHVLHPGDLTWHLFHMQADFTPADLIHLWEDGDRLAGFTLVYPRFGMFDIQMLERFRDSLFEEGLIEWSQAAIQELNPDFGGTFYTLAHEKDRERRHLLEANGYTVAGSFLYMLQSLDVSLAETAVAPGYRLTDMTEIDVERRANALAAAFEAPSRPDWYRKLVQSPGYDPALDIVAVAPDGQVAAFALCWIDPISKTGQFEPVGTVPEHRQQGLGKATLLEGLRRMKARGMTQAIVVVEAAEEPAVALYQSVGFTRRWSLPFYMKSMH